LEELETSSDSSLSVIRYRSNDSANGLTTNNRAPINRRETHEVFRGSLKIQPLTISISKNESNMECGGSTPLLKRHQAGVLRTSTTKKRPGTGRFLNRSYART